MLDISRQIKLAKVDYPEDILVAAGSSQPGETVSFEQSLIDAVSISQVSPTQVKTIKDMKFANGPFGAIRMVVQASKFFEIIYKLRNASAKDAVEELKSLRGKVASLGWNQVNAANCSETFFNPVAHAEMVALENAGKAIPIPVSEWGKENLIQVELSSSQNCESCESRNRLWGGTGLSMYALPTQRVRKALGFDEGEACHTDDRPTGKPWVNIIQLKDGFNMSSAYCPGLEDCAVKAFNIYTDTGAELYQVDYTKNIERVLNT